MRVIEIVRLYRGNDTTLGFLKVFDEGDEDNVLFNCFTLEPRVRPKKIMGKTAIPAGEYKVQYSMSTKYRRNMPFLMNVPNFTGVMIHTGNYASDTQGCILVGRLQNQLNAVYNSRLTFGELEKYIKGVDCKTVIHQPKYWP